MHLYSIDENSEAWHLDEIDWIEGDTAAEMLADWLDDAGCHSASPIGSTVVEVNRDDAQALGHYRIGDTTITVEEAS